MRQKDFKIFLLVVLAVACALGTLHAQNQEIAVVDIPFSFMVENTSFPAGKYTVKEYSFGELGISNEKLGISMFFMVETIVSETPAPYAKLVFDEFDNESFLSKIIIKGEDEGYYLPKSRSERALLAEAIKPSMKEVKF